MATIGSPTAPPRGARFLARGPLAAGATLALLLALAAQAAARPHLDADSLARLDKGEVLFYSQKVAGSNVMTGKAIGVFEDVPEAVIYVLLDVDKYKYYLPRMKDSRMVKQKGWHSYAVFETALPWPAKDCWAYLKFTRYDKPGRVYEIKWWMLNGTLKKYDGSALVEPWNDKATRSVLTYTLLFEPITSAPDSMVSEGVKKVARVIVDRTRLRLQALRKFNKLPQTLLEKR